MSEVMTPVLVHRKDDKETSNTDNTVQHCHLLVSTAKFHTNWISQTSSLFIRAFSFLFITNELQRRFLSSLQIL